MESLYKICSFTGHRDLSDETVSERLTQQIITLLEDGYRHFISGMALGFDLIAAETVIILKEKYSDIFLECAIPCETQADQWQHKEKVRYLTVLKQADLIKLISKNYTAKCISDRNKYLVASADTVIAYYDGRKTGGTYQTLKMSQEKERKIINIY